MVTLQKMLLLLLCNNIHDTVTMLLIPGRRGGGQSRAQKHLVSTFRRLKVSQIIPDLNVKRLPEECLTTDAPGCGLGES